MFTSPFLASALGMALATLGGVVSDPAPVVLIKQGDPVAGSTVSQVRTASTSPSGGFAIQVSPITPFSALWGSPSGGAGTTLWTPQTLGDLEQRYLGNASPAMGPDGEFLLSVIVNDLAGGGTDLASLWLDDTLVALEGDQVPSLPGHTWGGTFSSTRITGNGEISWIGYAVPPGASTSLEGIFRGPSANILYLEGDLMLGMTAPIEDLEYYDAEGAHTLVVVSTTLGEEVLMDGQVLVLGGSPVRTGEPVPASIGGSPGEVWDSFNGVAVGGSGRYAISASTNATENDVLVVDGHIRHRSGELLDGVAIQAGFQEIALNLDGDLGFRCLVGGPIGVDAWFVNGELVLRKGDEVDVDGDGLADAGQGVTGFFDRLALGARGADGTVDLYVAVRYGGGTQAAVRATSRWVDLGGGTTGVAGPPLLTLSGPLTAGSTLALELRHAAPASLAVLFIASASSPAAFLGGTLHAFPLDELIVLGTDGAGEIRGEALFPAVPAGQPFTFQVGIADPSVAVYGASLSNAMRGTAP